MNEQPETSPGRAGEAGTADAEARIEVYRRRAPRFAPFILTGAALGVLIALVVAALPAGPPVAGGAEFSTRTVTGFLAMIFGLLGAVVGGATAVLLDRRSGRGGR